MLKGRLPHQDQVEERLLLPAVEGVAASHGDQFISMILPIWDELIKEAKSFSVDADKQYKDRE